MEFHESNTYSCDYEQNTQFDMVQVIQNVIVDTTR